MKKLQVVFATAGALLCASTLAVALHLAFAFPKTVALWSDEGRALSSFQNLLVNLCALCTSFGLIIFPALLLGVAACIAWGILAGRKT